MWIWKYLSVVGIAVVFSLFIVVKDRYFHKDTASSIEFLKTEATAGNISVEEVRMYLSGNLRPVIIDVRESFEFSVSHIPGAISIPMSTFSKRVSEIPRDAHVVLVCSDGLRSARARDLLAEIGFLRIYRMLGGMNSWTGDLESSQK